jgi:hypothetical protein
MEESAREVTAGDPRPEGVYLHFETYPPGAFISRDNILVLERVNGDATVSRWSCARSEAGVIKQFLAALD